MGYLYLLLDLLQVRGPAVLGDRVHVVQLPHGRQGHRARARLPRALPLVAGRPHVPRLLAGDRQVRAVRLPRACAHAWSSCVPEVTHAKLVLDVRLEIERRNDRSTDEATTLTDTCRRSCATARSSSRRSAT